MSIGTSLAASLALTAAALAADVSYPSGRMLQFPDVSAREIVFAYANDVWVVPREGGLARPLAAPPGRETFPKFSPDGASIAFIGNYDGNRDVYVVPSVGGALTRLTFHPDDEIISDWTEDGRVIYYSNAQSGLARQDHIYTIAPQGGAPARLPVPYGTTGSISPDGTWLAYTPSTHDFRTWKRYRGGWAQDIWLFNLKDSSAKRISTWEGTDTIPMWAPGSPDKLYFLSDEGPSHRLNIWSHDLRTNTRQQVTDFADFDVKWPSMGPGPAGKGEIVFQLGSQLMLLDLATQKSRAVEIMVPGARPALRPQAVDASKFIQNTSISPSGKRLAVEARGDIWTLPAEEGVTRNLTRTSGVAERDPLFSPSGKHIAFVSDQTGEYELYLVDAEGKRPPVQLTTDGAAYRYMRSWSPDSRHIAFTDKTGAIYVHSLAGPDFDQPGSTRLVARDPWSNQNAINWSHDSSWLALVLGAENTQSVIWLYNVARGELTQATADMFNSDYPAFDRKGDWLYFATSRSFEPTYSDLDSTWVYRDGQVLMAIPLRPDVKNPLLPRSDEEGDDKKNDAGKADASRPAFVGVWRGELKRENAEPHTFVLRLTAADDGSVVGTAEAMGDSFDLATPAFDKQDAQLTFSVNAGDLTYTVKAKLDGSTLTGDWTCSDGSSGTLTAKRDADPIAIDLGAAGDLALERRAIQLPVKSGTFGGLAVNDSGKLIFMRINEGDDDGPGPSGDIKIYDFASDERKKEEKTVLEGARSFEMTADGKKLLVRKGEDRGVIDAAPDQKLEKKVPLSGMSVVVDPRAEWRQMFNDLWRIFRDYFYEPGMHNVDWAAQKQIYGRLVDDCATRDDLTFILAEMISELNVGHAYYRPGDQDTGPSTPVGLLGADFELVTTEGITAYRIARIVGGAAWDPDGRSPLAEPGVDARNGQFILAVNGAPIDVSRDIHAALIGAAGKPTSITLSDKPFIDDSARTVIVKPLASETMLRMRAWIEANRRYVAEKSGGKVGYVYVVNTQVPGQSDLVRQFYGQRHMPALIIDDRWNGGGQIPTRFIELLNRPRTNYWARRDGKDWAWPPDSHQGPKAMLINGLSASGGDMFPALFRQTGLGILIGTRTWGGLVGISGNPSLIDGTAPNVPTFGYYQTDGTWGIEGHGVDPDVEVLDDPSKMIPPAGAGPDAVADPQLQAAVDHLLREIETSGYRPPARPKGPDRRGMGIAPEDK
ncbi:MAG: PDZ domain-containing protein [Planctomycetota bacterium]|nr:PDZ domain-containing protein [Planctomycetota bacterium]